MTKKILRFPLLAAAFLFLFNPNITVIDLLPDFLGYIFLCAALCRVSDVHDRLAEAYRAFKRMIFIDAGKWLAVLWIFGLSVPSERNSSLLLWSFVFAVLEFIFLIPAYDKLFDGITQIGYLYPNCSIFGERGKRSRTDRMRNFTFVFIALKSVFSFLPELADLTNTMYDESMGGTINLYRYIGIMRFLAFVPVLIVGVIWLFCIISYFRRISKDGTLLVCLTQKYEKDILPKEGLFVRRNFSTVTLLATVTLLLTVDVRMEHHNILPDVLAALFFVLLFVFLGRYNGLKVKNWIFSTLAFIAFSTVAMIFEYKFFSEFYYGAIIKSDEARSLYMLVVSLNLLKGLCLMGVFVDLYRALLRTVKLHTGYVVGMERMGERETKMIAAVQHELKNSLTTALVFSALYVVSDTCFDIFAPKVGFMGLINIIFAVAGIGFFIKALSEIRQAIDTKYMLE